MTENDEKNTTEEPSGKPRWTLTRWHRLACVVVVLALPLLIVTVFGQMAGGPLYTADAGNSEFGVQEPEIDDENSEFGIRDSELDDEDSEFGIRDSEMDDGEDSGFGIRDSELDDEVSEFEYRDSESDDEDSEADPEEEAVVPPEPEFTKIAYLTIDDGPSRAITPGILDLLKAEGITATFFVLPQRDVNDLYERMIEEGHEIGNHSYSHNYSRLYQSDNLDAFGADVTKAHDWVLEEFGYEMTSFRFPGGSMGRGASVIAQRRAFLDEIGYRYFNWHIDSGDARADIPDKRASTLTGNVLRNTRDRDHLIILFHDTWDKRSTLEALPAVIAGLREQGYAFDILKNYPSD